MREGLRQAMLGRMKALQANITTLNMIADELEKSANLLDAQPKAKDMRGLALRQRAKVLEMQNLFAALQKIYSERYHHEA